MAQNGIQISMDGKGRALDNIWIERFWKSIKYNHIYLNPADDGRALKAGIHKYITYYNSKIHHTTREAPKAQYHCPMLKAA
jgi:putative transposase